MSRTHTAVAATAKGQFDAIQVPTPSPGEGEVLIEVEYASMVAFDTYITDRGFYVAEYPAILGFNGAGTVVEVGLGVGDLKLVTAYGIGASRHKSLQEYMVEPETRVAKVGPIYSYQRANAQIPDSLPFAEAATIPNSFVTAFYTLFNQLGLLIPVSFPATEPPPLATTPILVYGAGSTVGSYAIQLLHLAGYRNIIVTASTKHHEHLRSLGATHTFDYHSPTLIKDVEKVTGGHKKLTIALDCITAESTLNVIAQLLSLVGKLAILLPVKEGDNVTNGQGEALLLEIPEGKNPFSKETEIIGIRTLLYERDEYLKKNLVSKILPALLSSGYIKPSRVRLLDSGTLKERAAAGLNLLRNNKISGKKVVVKVV